MISWDTCLSLSDLLSVIISGSIHGAVNGIISLFFFGWIIFHCIHVPHLLYPSLCGHLGCFHVLATVNSAAVNIRVHDSFQIIIFSEYMLRCGIARSYGSSIFSFLRSCHTVLCRGCTNLHSHQSGRAPLSLHSLQHLQIFWGWPFWPVWGEASFKFGFAFL